MLGDHLVKSWSTNQSVVALSSGEAEFYALTRGSAIALGFQSLLADLGIHLRIRVMTDATSGRAIASRRGLGKVRHIATHELWIQEHVLRGHIELVKIKNTFNSSDVFATHLDRSLMEEAISQLGHKFTGGRSSVAPE